MENVRTCLWYDHNALQAVRFYQEVLGDVEILNIAGAAQADYPGGAAGEVVDGQNVLTVDFRVGDQRFVGLNGGPEFPFTEAASIQIDCADQAEVDRLWAAFTADGGAESQCGWCKDRFGLSWQIVPKAMFALLGDPDPGRARRATEAMLTMRKIDLAAIEAAADRSE